MIVSRTSVFRHSDIVEGFPELRASVLTKLYQRFADIETSEVARVALWILGQYCDDAASLHSALSCIKECIGPLPLSAPMTKAAAAAEETPAPVEGEVPACRCFGVKSPAYVCDVQPKPRALLCYLMARTPRSPLSLKARSLTPHLRMTAWSVFRSVARTGLCVCVTRDCLLFFPPLPSSARPAQAASKRRFLPGLRHRVHPDQVSVAHAGASR